MMYSSWMVNPLNYLGRKDRMGKKSLLKVFLVGVLLLLGLSMVPLGASGQSAPGAVEPMDVSLQCHVDYGGYEYSCVDNTATFYYQVNHGNAKLHQWTLELPSDWDASKVNEVRYVADQGCSSSRPSNWTSFLSPISVNGTGPGWWVSSDEPGADTCDQDNRHLHIEGDLGTANTCTWFRVVFNGVWRGESGHDYTISGQTCEASQINGPRNQLQSCPCTVVVTLNGGTVCSGGTTTLTATLTNACDSPYTRRYFTWYRWDGHEWDQVDSGYDHSTYNAGVGRYMVKVICRSESGTDGCSE